jgi:hypothetical protein
MGQPATLDNGLQAAVATALQRKGVAVFGLLSAQP